MSSMAETYGHLLPLRTTCLRRPVVSATVCFVTTLHRGRDSGGGGGGGVGGRRRGCAGDRFSRPVCCGTSAGTAGERRVGWLA